MHSNEREKILEQYKVLLDIQLQTGNWDADPYMHGMANGMILMNHILENKSPGVDPPFKSAPAYWVARIPRWKRGIKTLSSNFWWNFKFFVLRVITIITNLTFEFNG